ncbi:nucleoside triphosphate pyrophosphohydrolase [Porticoccaceae bacterium]|jgi:ATP diphosphatase|nr:nucleoside triphosphate pyrophosphohydrolase [Porticoccaceae bacterium]MDA9014326.1 nucleoside triphosphate pyrophosphohydrolase [Porticoccaceae bacterium]
MPKHYSIKDLRYLMARLRDPETGCPWDIKQSYTTIASYTVEEVYEVVDAIERNNLSDLSEELGDLLFQIIFYCQMAEEQGQFDFDTVINHITTKLVRRHPHVFPDGTLESSREGASIDEQQIKQNWEAIKQEERQKKGNSGILDDVPNALPAQMRATKLQKRAANYGFDWPNAEGVIDKVKEELAELQLEVDSGDKARQEEELGDLMFACVNLARHLSIDPERALAKTNNKFVRRFESMDAELDLKNNETFTADALEQAWIKAKQAE